MVTNERLWTRLLCSIVYAVMASVLTYYVSQRFQDETFGGDHTATIRSLVIRPMSSETLDAVGGLEDVKKELRRTVLLPLRYPRIFFEGPASIRPPPGVLLHGPPGTGKTMIARAIASESKVPLLALNSAALESKWWGETPKLLQAAFRFARSELSPCIVFFDEIDGLGRNRNEQDQSSVYSFKCELLRNMDSVVDEGVIVLACTNCPDSLDPALRRRFPKVLHIDRPNTKGRLDILRILTQDESVVDEDVLHRVAAETPNMTGADIRALFADASAARMEGMGDLVHSVQSGEELLGALGPVEWEHWKRALLLRGRIIKNVSPQTSLAPKEDRTPTE